MGRWVRPVRVQYENRRCRICYKLEDEYHFIVESPVYFNLRKAYIDKYYIHRPSMFKLTQLFSPQSKKDLKKPSYIHFQSVQ